MKYQYYDKKNRLLAESDTPIKFNTMLFPIFKDIEPVVSEAKAAASVKKTESKSAPKSTGTNKTEEKKK